MRVNDRKPADELCDNCDHVFYKHIYSGTLCADTGENFTGCEKNCKQFIPSGRYYNYGRKK